MLGFTVASFFVNTHKTSRAPVTDTTNEVGVMHICMLYSNNDQCLVSNPAFSLVATGPRYILQLWNALLVFSTRPTDKPTGYPLIVCETISLVCTVSNS